jgi:hypothetical protein
VYRLAMIKSNNIWNPIGICQGEDVYFITLALMHAKLVYTIPENALNCLIRVDSAMHSKFNTTHLQVYEVYKMLYTDIEQFTFLDNKVKNELLLYTKMNIFFGRIVIAKKITESFNVFNAYDAIQTMNKYDNTSVKYNEIKDTLTFFNKLLCYIYFICKYLFFYLCKMFLLVKNVKDTFCKGRINESL